MVKHRTAEEIEADAIAALKAKGIVPTTDAVMAYVMGTTDGMTRILTNVKDHQLLRLKERHSE